MDGPGERRDWEAASIGRSEMSSGFISMAGTLAYPLELCALLNGPRGSITKKETSIMHGRNADARREVLTLSPMVDVKSTYSPAPIKPAPPVPLPQAARLNGP